MTRDVARYVELRAHSAFSFGDGTATPEALVERAVALGYTALGLTDTADLGGIVRFTRAAEQHELRPIVGVELVVDGFPVALLARSAEGYRHIAALVTLARAGHVHAWNRDDAGRSAGTPDRGRPQVTWAALAERSAGLHALTGPASGALAALLRAGRVDDARRHLARWRAVFDERLAVEVQLHQASRVEEALAGALIELAESNGVPWVVVNDPRYLDRKGRLAHDVLTALRADCTIDEAADRGLLLPNSGWQLLSPEVMATRWASRPQGIEESARIAAECAFELGWARPPLPAFTIPEDFPSEDVNEYLRHLVFRGAHDRWGELDQRQTDQLEHELAVIKSLGFAGFFLVMWDIVREARTQSILCQGRGSAANSAVAYCLGITAVDPVRHGLLFERFLSEARVKGTTEAPDIDLDLEHDRREEILDYAYQRWHRHQAAITCIVQTYHAPNAVQDSMRAFGYPAELATRLSKRVHRYDPVGGADRLRNGLAARHGLEVTSPRGRALLAAIEAFQDLPRLRSTHPGGFVLSSEPLGDYAPIEPTTMGRTIVQFDKDDLDIIGIPKFDFLGLGALSHVRRAFDEIERYAARPSLYHLPPDDPEAFRLISEGDTIGMFQIESRAQIASLVHTRPDRLYDIVVQVALIRPGPIQARFVHPYTRRRRGLETVTYPHPKLESILKRTQGIPIFQEQAMAIAMELADYSATEADELRRTMGNHRKMPKLLSALDKLRQRIVGEGIADAVAQRIADDLQSFGNYGFPESHAWSFALIAYATAWLKAHHPAAFYAGILNAWPMGFYSPATLVHDAKRHGVEVRGPCFARGRWDCTVERDETIESSAMPPRILRIGWRYVHGIGDRTRTTLERAHREGPFVSIADVVRRTGLTAHEAVAFARAGAFAVWEQDRRRAAWAALHVVGDTLPLAPAGATASYHPSALDRDATIFLDYAALGLSVTGHPMERWRAYCRKMHTIDSRELLECHDGDHVVVAGLVAVRQQPQTAKGTIFLLLEDELGVINIIVSPQLVREQEEIVRHATFVIVYGRVEREGRQISVVSQRLEPLADADSSLAYHSHDFR